MTVQPDRDSRLLGYERLSPEEWTFEINESPLSRDEQAVFSQDLEQLGSNETVWKILNGALAVSSKYSKPKVLRAYENAQLVGAAYFVECRRVGDSLFSPPVSTILNMPGMPVFVWSRYGIGTDNTANPGFVTPGVDRQTFVERAIAALTRKYMYGSILDCQDVSAVPGGLQTAAFDNGYINTDSLPDLDAYLNRHKNLRKKMNRFRNKGGAIEVVRGAMSPDDRDAVVALYRTMKHRIFTAYQEIFVPLVIRIGSIDDSNIVHIITRLDGEMVGYHSYYIGGQTLHCLSGGFDRSRKSTYHAYENLIIESVQLALDHGLRTIHYGPVLNDTKTKMMTSFRTLELRTHPRYGFMKPVFSALMGRSSLMGDEIRQYRGLGSGRGDLSADGGRHTVEQSSTPS